MGYPARPSRSEVTGQKYDTRTVCKVIELFGCRSNVKGYRTADQGLLHEAAARLVTPARTTYSSAGAANAPGMVYSSLQ